jgi:hypothetical protein
VAQFESPEISRQSAMFPQFSSLLCLLPPRSEKKRYKKKNEKISHRLVESSLYLIRGCYGKYITKTQQ